MFLVAVLAATLAQAGERLTVDDFRFDGPLGSEGASVEELGGDHFRITLGHAPEHSDWANMAQFEIVRHAKGHAPTIDVVFTGGNQYKFNDYFYSWSYDGAEWHPIEWQRHEKDSAAGDTLVFPEFAEDHVYIGHQVPMSAETAAALIDEWAKNPCVGVHALGQSLGGRMIHRIEITAPDSPVPRAERWVHYVGNQHPGEHNAQWRMVGMIQWLLSDAGADCRHRSIVHFVLMTSPDAPSHGWYRVNAQGVDMNRSYKPEGADPETQAHEACLVQKDLEALMASDAPVTDLWSMHTWQGIVEPIVEPGPEMGASVGTWEDLRDVIERNDPDDLVKPLGAHYKSTDPGYWTLGPHTQFGITTVLCEGGGSILTKEQNIASGAVLMKSLAEYYRGTRPATP